MREAHAPLGTPASEVTRGMRHVVYFAGVVLLAVAGATKVLDPFPTHRALRAAGWPNRPVLVRVLAVAELAVAAAAVLIEHAAVAFVVAGLYAGFTVFVVVALARGLVISSCGCFGSHDTAPSPRHVAINASAAAAALLVGFEPPRAARSVTTNALEGAGLAAASLALAAVAFSAIGDIRSVRSRRRRH